MTESLPNSSEDRAEWLGRRLDPIMAALGVVFALVVMGETIASEDGALGRGLAIASWTLWSIFVVEFVMRAVIAGSPVRYVTRNWWQIIFLVLPFLRFFRALQTFRWLRAGRVFSSAVRAGRSATRQLGDRLAWLAAITAIVILASSQLLYEYGGFGSYADALHGAALASITGEPLRIDSGLARVLDVILALYSVVVFAALAASLGAYFLRRAVPTDLPDPVELPSPTKA